MRALAAVLMVGVLGCRSDGDGSPAWAIDTLTLDPDGQTATALQAWTLHDARWERRATRRALVCSTVVELTLEPGASGCEDCDVAYAVVDQRVADSDCDQATLDAFVLLDRTTAVGVGPLPEALADEAPLADARGGRVRVADRWLDHGWAYPTGADTGEVQAGPWDGVRTFTLQPAWAWDLGETSRAPTERDTDVAVAD